MVMWGKKDNGNVGMYMIKVIYIYENITGPKSPK
jgi:hypothetical protein